MHFMFIYLFVMQNKHRKYIFVQGYNIFLVIIKCNVIQFAKWSEIIGNKILVCTGTSNLTVNHTLMECHKVNEETITVFTNIRTMYLKRIGISS